MLRVVIHPQPNWCGGGLDSTRDQNRCARLNKEERTFKNKTLNLLATIISNINKIRRMPKLTFIIIEEIDACHMLQVDYDILTTIGDIISSFSTRLPQCNGSTFCIKENFAYSTQTISNDQSDADIC